MTAVQILPAENNAVSPLELMQDAIGKGASVEMMQQLLDLYKSARDFAAEKAFHAAMAKAKAEIPVIAKTNSAFGRYLYEDIGDIADVVVPILSKYDLYYRWETAPGSAPGTTIVTCVIAHKDGHSIRNSLPAVAETRGSQMNANQAVGSSITYVQRYTLKAALGLAAAKDDDGQAAGNKPPAKPAPAYPPKGKTYEQATREDLNREPIERSDDEANEQTSGDVYAQRWQEVMAAATSGKELAIAWNGERILRTKINWHDNQQEARLKEMVVRRSEELKAAQDEASQ